MHMIEFLYCNSLTQIYNFWVEQLQEGYIGDHHGLKDWALSVKIGNQYLKHSCTNL